MVVKHGLTLREECRQRVFENMAKGEGRNGEWRSLHT
jgi:hypothetical protein